MPDDQNFFTAPIFTNLINGKIAMVPYGNDGGPDLHREVRRSGYAVYPMEMADLQAWQKYYRNPTTNHGVVEMFMTNGVMIVQTNDLQRHGIGEFPTAAQPKRRRKMCCWL